MVWLIEWKLDWGRPWRENFSKKNSLKNWIRLETKRLYYISGFECNWNNQKQIYLLAQVKKCWKKLRIKSIKAWQDSSFWYTSKFKQKFKFNWKTILYSKANTKCFKYTKERTREVEVNIAFSYWVVNLKQYAR